MGAGGADVGAVVLPMGACVVIVIGGGGIEADELDWSLSFDCSPPERMEFMRFVRSFVRSTALW